MAETSFGQQVLEFKRKTLRKRDDVLRQAFRDLANELQALCPKDTHFLMSTLTGSRAGLPTLSAPNPNPNAAPATYKWDDATIVGIVSSAKYGETLYLGYRADYARIVHDGHGGREPQPWVRLVAQRWRSIVAEAAKKVKGNARAQS